MYVLGLGVGVGWVVVSLLTEDQPKWTGLLQSLSMQIISLVHYKHIPIYFHFWQHDEKSIFQKC